MGLGRLAIFVTPRRLTASKASRNPQSGRHPRAPRWEESADANRTHWSADGLRGKGRSTPCLTVDRAHLRPGKAGASQTCSVSRTLPKGRSNRASDREETRWWPRSPGVREFQRVDRWMRPAWPVSSRVPEEEPPCHALARRMPSTIQSCSPLGRPACIIHAPIPTRSPARGKEAWAVHGPANPAPTRAAPAPANDGRHCGGGHCGGGHCGGRHCGGRHCGG